MQTVTKGKKNYELLADVISKYQYGDVITHSQIEDIIGEVYGTAKYNSVISSAKKVLQEHGKAIENIRSHGYRVINPDDYIIHSARHYKRAFNEIKRGKSVLDCAPIENMTPDGKEKYRMVYDRSVLLEASMAGAQVEIKKLIR